MRRSLPLPALLALAASLVPVGARAEPYLALREGLRCSQCHVSPTGGGQRNSFGTIFGQTRLPWRTVSSEDVRSLLGALPNGATDSDRDGDFDGVPDSTFYSGYVTPFLSVGGDFRFRHTTRFRNADDSRSSSFDTDSANLYATVELLEGSVSFSIDEKVAPGGATAREVFAMVRGPWSSYVRAGRILLPFGLRLEDDSAFVRELTGFNFGTQDIGAEVGVEPGPLSISAAASNGTQGSSDDNDDKQITGMASFIQRYWRVGAQASWNNGTAAKRVAFGGFAGLHLGFAGAFAGRFTLLGEVDRIIDELEGVADETTERQLVAYGAVHCQLVRGVDLRVAYDYADPDTSESEDAFTRWSAGIDYTITQFLQLRSVYRFRDDVESSVRDDESVLEFEVHLFF